MSSTGVDRRLDSESNPLRRGSGYALAERQLVDAKADAGFAGYDILTIDEQGLILTVLFVR